MDGWIFRFVAATLLFSGAWLPSHTFGIGDTHLCSAPLGMESGAIPDSALNASSFYAKSVGVLQSRLNSDGSGGGWCPKEPIAIGVREWLEVSFNETQLISGVQVQGRFAKGTGQEYTEEFELEYWRDGFDVWRKYYRFDGKTVIPANSDTSTVITNKLRPPMIAKKIRILPYSNHRRTVCLRLELLGCPWQNDLVEYRMEQGDVFLEGISLRDESYDGQGSKWDRRVIAGERQDHLHHTHNQHHHPQQTGGLDKENVVNIFHRPSSMQQQHQHHNDDDGSDRDFRGGGGEEDDSAKDGDEAAEDEGGREEDKMNSSVRDRHLDGGGGGDRLLTAGLGQLTDKIEGANSFTMDIAYGLGNGWVGWKQKKSGEDMDEYVEILFEFNSPRKFSYMDLFTNNYPSKKVETFARVKVYFSIGGVHFNGRPLIFVPVSDGSLEHARNVSISLENRAGRFIRLQLYFRSTWIVLGEVYFHSEIYDGNYTTELGPDAQVDFPDTQSPLEIGEYNSSIVETVVGVISGVVLLLGGLTGLLFWMRRNGRSISSAFTFHPSAPWWRTTWSSVPTHIVTQTNPATEGVKDLLLTLTPLSGCNGGSGGGGGGGNGHATVVVVNGDFKAHNPPPAYTNGTTSTNITTAKHPNGLQLQGPHYNNYGSTTTKSASSKQSTENGSNLNLSSNTNTTTLKMDNGLIGSTLSHRQHQQQQHPHQYGSSTLTLRSNQLAALDELEGKQQQQQLSNSRDPSVMDYDYDVDLDEDIYHEASTLSINNATLRTRNRRMKVAGSVWNLVSGSRSGYRNHRGRVAPEVSLRQLRLIENLGSCLYGQVHLYDFEGEIACPEGTLYRNCRLIAKTIKSLSEIRLLTMLDHEHVLAMIAVCSEMKKPLLALYPNPECGDLCSFLSRLSNTPSLSWLLNVGAQIASGMHYLESLSLIHRDLSARNCLVEREGSIRISDLAMACEQYRGDYVFVTTVGQLRPLRWWSWESILTDEFTMQSSVWSFGVTLWEILTLCRQKPLAHVADHQITTLAEKYGSTATSLQTWLPQPLLSPPEIFDLMRECWHPTERPSFQHISLFLEQKCNAVSTIYHVV